MQSTYQIKASSEKYFFAGMNQLCKVCGEPAAGFHFGAFTCEGCKSFFGRTYNNLSQIHECKNGGVCIINKQNRTSCKACRLRKCLFVGMSKSGSRYGRRSNWFKIHCLLQEQASFANQPPSFRTPATPTLQDGSLPFVATQLRDPMAGMDSPLSHSTEISSASSPISLSSQSPISRIGVASLSPQLAPTYSSSLLASDRRLHEASLVPQRNFPVSCEGTYREHLLNLIQRSQGFDALRSSHEADQIDEGRSSSEIGTHLGPLAFTNWEKRIQEASRRMAQASPNESKPASPKQISEELTRDSKSEPDRNVKTCTEKLEGTQSRSLPNSPRTNSPEKKGGRTSPAPNVGKNSEPKEQETLMTDEERLAFLKSASSISSSYRSNFKNDPIKGAMRFPGHNELMYSPLNNNIFPFPTYPPVWSSIIPFSPFSKLYPPFCTPPAASPLSFDPPKPNLSFDRPVEGYPFSPKEDPLKKKRFLDAILQVQKERRSSADRSPLNSPPRSSSRNSNSPPPREPLVVRSTSITSSSDQPMDLTVRRKRKMDKSEIMYKPSDDMEDMDSDMDKGEPVGMKLPETSVPSPTTSEMPMKFIKLDSTSETLTV